MNLKYEKMSKSDYADVRRLIKQAWFSDEEYEKFSKRTIDLYEKGYLYMYLSELDYCKVVKDGNNVIGFIFGRGKKIKLTTKIFYKIKLFFIGLSLLMTKSGRRGIKITRITTKANKYLYKNSSVKPECELVLFIVDKNYQGQKIGSTLEKDFCDYVKSIGKDSLYLYTDTYSNYEYYEHRGYKRTGEIDVDFKIKGEEEYSKSKYYIYVKEFENENNK